MAATVNYARTSWGLTERGGSSAFSTSSAATAAAALPLDGLVDVHLRDGDWHTAANYVKPGTCLEEIAIRVEL
jgi:hypothetical protein